MVVSSWTLLRLESIYWWILNKMKISCSFSRCFGRTTTDFYELMIAYRRYFMKLFMFLDGVSCEGSVNNDVLAQW